MKWKMKKVKKIVIILVVLGLIGLTASLTVGRSEQDEALAQESQTWTVQRGDLSLEITAAGNLALSHTEDLSIDLFYQEGTVEEVLVEEGDTIEEGQVLVKLDTDEWNDELSTLEEVLATAQRNLTSKQNALTKAERQVITLEREVADRESAVTKAEREITDKEFAVRQAELNVQTAEYNFNQIEEVREALEDLDQAEDNLDFVKKVLAGEFGGGFTVPDLQYWWQLRENAEEDLEYAQEELNAVLAGTSTTITSSNDAEGIILEISKKQLLIEQEKMALEDAELAVADAQKAVDDAKYTLESAKLDVKDAEQAVEDARLDVEDAKQAVEDAQSDLDEAKGLSPVITAPFDGFITKVNVEGGDEILKGTVAVQIADPNKFEAEILVSEMDILQVELGGEAQVQVDALDLTLPAEVTHIAPTATISSGVVNYAVTVEVQSTDEESSQATSGEDEAESVQLREGLTVALSLIVSQRSDVLLVPYTATTTEGGQSYVQVVSQDGTTEKRAVTTGITDYQYTEVTEGLDEGEQVLMSGAITTASESTDDEQSQGGGMMMPGMGIGGGEPPAGGGPPGG
jgi:RND family efflux transporter MFP subunit